MRILLVTGRFPQRSETFIYRQAVALARRGHEVTVVAREAGDWGLYPDTLPESLHTVTLPPDDRLREVSRIVRALAASARTTSSAPARALTLWRQCRQGRDRASAIRTFARHVGFLGLEADVIHFEFFSLAALYPLAGTVVGAATVISCRGQDLHTFEFRPSQQQEELREVLREATALHCVSDELAATVTRLTGRTTGIWVNRAAVDTEALVPHRHASKVPVRLISSGRLIWVKGYDYLLAALAKLERQGVDFRATILGEGELMSSLRFSIEDLGLEDRVSLAGGVSPAAAIAALADADVFVLSSHDEGISNAALEAMAAGLPVVSTNAGGMNEAITDGVEGFVVPTHDVDALASRLAEVISNPDLRTRMGEAARRRAIKDFSLDRQTRVFEQLYESVRT